MTWEALLRPLEDPRTVHQRHHYRARFWRLALGALGLFCVAVLLLLMR